MSAVKDLFDQIMKAIDKKTKKAGTNYTARSLAWRVTRRMSSSTALPSMTRR